MNHTALQQAMLIEFAVREAGPKGSLEQMEAICYCIRNRVRAGWYEASWLANIEHAFEVRTNEPPAHMLLDENDRNLQRLMQRIEDIYYGTTQDDQNDGTLEASIGNSTHWAFLNRPMTPHGVDMLSHSEAYPVKCQMGLMIFV